MGCFLVKKGFFFKGWIFKIFKIYFIYFMNKDIYLVIKWKEVMFIDKKYVYNFI